MFKICYILLFKFPLDKALDYSLAFLVSIYSGLKLRYIKGRVSREIVTGIIIYLMMVVSTIAPIWAVSLLFGSHVEFNFVAAIAVAPFMFTVGLGEETLFRGLLQGLFVEKYGSRIGIFLVSFLLFLIWHVVWINAFKTQFTYVSFLLYSGFLGIILGVAYEKSGSLLAVIIAHGLWDIMISSLKIPIASVPFRFYLISILVCASIYLLVFKVYEQIFLNLFLIR
ncbi:MAG: CPBP family intramembrane glutamic endopeptidase [Candidatus Njordarchaeia archaeon]